MGSTCTQLLFHIVFSTKDRQPLITPALQEVLYKYIGGIIRGEGGSLIEIGQRYERAVPALTRAAFQGKGHLLRGAAAWALKEIQKLDVN